MVVRMRLRPTGLRNNPSFDVVVTRNPLRPTAAPIEKLGEYLPVPSVLPSSQTPRASTSSSSSILQPLPEPKAEKSLKINKDRIAYWMKAGAQPTESVTRLLTKAGILHRDEFGKQQVTGFESVSKRAQKRAELRQTESESSEAQEARQG